MQCVISFHHCSKRNDLIVEKFKISALQQHQQRRLFPHYNNINNADYFRITATSTTQIISALQQHQQRRLFPHYSNINNADCKCKKNPIIQETNIFHNNFHDSFPCDSFPLNELFPLTCDSFPLNELFCFDYY